jgi:peptide/nickel transport system permease protein
LVNQSAAVHPLRHPLVRAATLELRGRPYLEAALLLGVKNQVLIRHIFPNVLPIELANAFLTVAMTSTAPPDHACAGRGKR